MVESPGAHITGCHLHVHNRSQTALVLLDQGIVFDQPRTLSPCCTPELSLVVATAEAASAAPKEAATAAASLADLWDALPK